MLKTTLAHYNREKPIITETDASKYGLGTALFQDGHPLVTASKTVTNTESRYARSNENVFQHVLS